MQRLAALAAVLLAVSAVTYAEQYNFGGTTVDISAWADDGSASPASTSVLVIDFGPQSVGLGYHYTGPATTADMLLALDAQTNLVLDATDWGGSLGLSVNQIAWGNMTATSDWVNSFLGFWGGDGNGWTPQDTGASGRTLSDGSWDGFSIETDTFNYTFQNPPDIPAPEPATAALLVGGALALIRRRR